MPSWEKWHFPLWVSKCLREMCECIKFQWLPMFQSRGISSHGLFSTSTQDTHKGYKGRNCWRYFFSLEELFPNLSAHKFGGNFVISYFLISRNNNIKGRVFLHPGDYTCLLFASQSSLQFWDFLVVTYASTNHVRSCLAFWKQLRVVAAPIYPLYCFISMKNDNNQR